MIRFTELFHQAPELIERSRNGYTAILAATAHLFNAVPPYHVEADATVMVEYDSGVRCGLLRALVEHREERRCCGVKSALL